MFLGKFFLFLKKKVVSLKKTKSCRIFKTNREFFLPIPSSNLYIILVWKIYSRSHGNFSICFGDFQQQWVCIWSVNSKTLSQFRLYYVRTSFKVYKNSKGELISEGIFSLVLSSDNLSLNFRLKSAGTVICLFFPEWDHIEKKLLRLSHL